jgi:rod shape-determining protein MreD
MIYDKKVLLRNIALILFILLFSLLQNTSGIIPEPFGARAFLLIPLTVFIGMFERGVSGTLLGAFAGILWDVSSDKDGFFGIMMFLTAFFCTLMITYLMRNNIASALVLTALCLAVNILVFIILFYVLSGVEDILYFVFRFYLPSYIFTLLLSPVVYLLVRAVYGKWGEFRRIKI